jgi:hypothetical protein
MTGLERLLSVSPGCQWKFCRKIDEEISAFGRHEFQRITIAKKLAKPMKKMTGVKSFCRSYKL